MLKKTIIIPVLFVASLVRAQIEPMYGMYKFNANAINPAQAGASRQLEAGLLSRWQWTALDGAPKTHVASVSYPHKQNVGFGLNIVSDRIGPVSDLYVGLDYSYSIPITNKTKFHAGLRLSVINHQVNLANRKLIDATDEAFQYNLNSGYRVNPGLGFLLSNPKYYVGISLPRLLRFSYGDMFNISTYKDVQHTFIYGGYQFKINREIEFRPSAIANIAIDAPLSLDFNAVTTLYNMVDIGLMYRMGDAVGLITGYQFPNGLYAGYSYEYPISQIRRVTRMSHEVALRFTFDAVKGKKIYTPRYFN